LVVTLATLDGPRPSLVPAAAATARAQARLPLSGRLCRPYLLWPAATKIRPLWI